VTGRSSVNDGTREMLHSGKDGDLRLIHGTTQRRTGYNQSYVSTGLMLNVIIPGVHIIEDLRR